MFGNQQGKQDRESTPDGKEFSSSPLWLPLGALKGRNNPISPALQVRDISFGDYFAWSPQLPISVMPLKTKALTGGKPLTIVCPWQNAMIHPKFLSPLNPDTDSPREDAKRLKTIDWAYWKISSTPFLVDGVSWSSLAGGALRSTQAKSLIEPSDRIHVGPSGGDGHRCYCAGRQPVGAMVAGNFGGYRRVGTSGR
jgi:hypothetical protein